jgi:hypothetical protein
VTVARATVGVREGILVTGYCSMQMDLRCAPWLKPKQLPRHLLVYSPSAAALQFGFKTACIDPPLLEQTIRELNVIVQYLNDLKLPETMRKGPNDAADVGGRGMAGGQEEQRSCVFLI